jgi:hypothetical protein
MSAEVLAFGSCPTLYSTDVLDGEAFVEVPKELLRFASEDRPE